MELKTKKPTHYFVKVSNHNVSPHVNNPLNPPNRNTKVLPSHCEKVGKKRKLIFAFPCQLINVWSTLQRNARSIVFQLDLFYTDKYSILLFKKKVTVVFNFHFVSKY